MTASAPLPVPALLEWGTKVRMYAGIATTGNVVGCWHTHPNTERMVALYGAWVAENLAYPVAKVAWSDGEVSYERVADLVEVAVASLWDKSAPSAERVRADAQRTIDTGDVEHGWYLHGSADRLEGRAVDPAQAHDLEYGSYYRRGFHGHPY
jgi:hypothetical protein